MMFFCNISLSLDILLLKSETYLWQEPMLNICVCEDWGQVEPTEVGIEQLSDSRNVFYTELPHPRSLIVWFKITQ